MKLLAWPRLLFTALALGLLFGVLVVAKGAPPQAPPLRSVPQAPPLRFTCACRDPSNCVCSPGTCECANCTVAAEVEVRCPEGATISFDGRPTQQTGTRRLFTTGAGGTYTVDCECPGLPPARRSVRVVAGGRTVVDFLASTAPVPTPAPVYFGPPLGGFGGACRGGS